MKQALLCGREAGLAVVCLATGREGLGGRDSPHMDDSGIGKGVWSIHIWGAAETRAAVSSGKLSALQIWAGRA